MVNTRYKVQKNEGIVGGFHGINEKCGDKHKAKTSLKRSMSVKLNKVMNFFRTPE